MLARKKTKGLDGVKSQGRPGGHLKIPWAKVAEYIVDHGASYEFGNATCRKKWEEVNAGKEIDSLGEA